MMALYRSGRQTEALDAFRNARTHLVAGVHPGWITVQRLGHPGMRCAPRERAVGSQPFGLAVDQQVNTVYVTEIFQAGSMSILDAARS
jgi:Bacterial transcriptional activator domain